MWIRCREWNPPKSVRRRAPLNAGTMPGRSRPGIFRSVQPAKHPEYLLLVLWVDTDAIIADRKKPMARLLNGGDRNQRRRVRPPVLDRVADQVLKNLHDVYFRNIDLRQIGYGEGRLCSLQSAA